MNRPAFYAPIGTKTGDFIALLHPPYTAWHLSYVVLGAAVAPRLDGLVLTGTLLAFFLGLGIGAHALDELHGRPLRTSLSRQALLGLGVGGMLGALVVAVIGAIVVSPWVLAWAAIGIALASGYAFEKPPPLHTLLGFGLAWGAFPTLVGFWSQEQSIGLAAIAMAGFTTVLSMVQRTLSTPARYLRRNVESAELLLERDHSVERWAEQRILESWERPLKLLTVAVILLAVGLVIAK